MSGVDMGVSEAMQTNDAGSEKDDVGGDMGVTFT